jgi:DNA-binding MarR family transcriptional regulator
VVPSENEVSNPLPPKQQACLDLVRHFLFSFGFPPSLSEIAERLEVAKPTAQSHVDKLIKKGFLVRTIGRLMLSAGENPHELIKKK